jgi:hypothetical protein
VGGELRETNPCFFVWFASPSCFSSIFDLLPLRSTWVVLLVCAGLITLLVIIYKGHSPSMVSAGSQEELEVVFAGALCYTCLIGDTH